MRLYYNIFTDAVTVELYADDVKIYSSTIVNEKAIGQELQQNLNKLTKWTNDWQLPISYTIFTDAVTVKLYADDVKS